MSLTLQILNGHRYGEDLVIEKPTTVGRLADQSFDDVKMSKVHAIFEMVPPHGWSVRDSGSKNGVVVNENKVELHYLAEGDLIEIGETQLRVASVSAFWKPQLNQLLIESFDRVRNAELTLYPFRQIPVLHFVQGMELGKKIVLEYGPRFIGGESHDIQILEPLSPDMAFELHRNPKGVLFVTNYPRIVKLNGKDTEKKILKKGDQIHIHNTVIEVDFLNI